MGIGGLQAGCCKALLTADVGVHGSTAPTIVSADALSIVTVPSADPATPAGCEEEVAVPVVLDAGQGTVVALEEDRPHLLRGDGLRRFFLA